jgi:hypothetical protein
MISYYHQAHARLDAENAEPLPNGRWRQEIEHVFSDDPDRPSWQALEPAVCALAAFQARELAFELLTLAEVAEHREQVR